MDVIRYTVTMMLMIVVDVMLLAAMAFLNDVKHCLKLVYLKQWVLYCNCRLCNSIKEKAKHIVVDPLGIWTDPLAHALRICLLNQRKTLAFFSKHNLKAEFIPPESQVINNFVIEILNRPPK